MAECKTWIDPSIRGTWTLLEGYKNTRAKERRIAKERQRAQPILKTLDAKSKKGRVHHRGACVERITAAEFTAQLEGYMDECFEQKQPPVARDFAERLGYARSYFSGTSSTTNHIIHDRIKEFRGHRDKFWERLTEWAEEESYRLTVKHQGKYSLQQIARDYKWPKNNIYRAERWKPVKDAVYRGIERGKHHIDSRNNSVITRYVEAS